MSQVRLTVLCTWTKSSWTDPLLFKIFKLIFLLDCANKKIRNSLENLDSEFILEILLRTLATITHIECLDSMEKKFLSGLKTSKSYISWAISLLLFCGHCESMFLFLGNPESSLKPASSNYIVLSLYIFMYLLGLNLFSFFLDLLIYLFKSYVLCVILSAVQALHGIRLSKN